MDEEKVLPVGSGDWIVQKTDSRPQVGRVIRSYWDTDDICLVDVTLYDHDGNRVGRTSPIEGGPSRFEPAIQYTDRWQRIREPVFPIEERLVLAEPDSNGMRRVRQVYSVVDRPERLKRRKMTPRTAKPVIEHRNFDQEAERMALLRSAQELRDAARALPNEVRPTLIARAETLEAEAARLA